MPLSLRFPQDLEHEVASYSVRAGISKSALIVRSVREFLAAHAQPTSYEMYEAAMRAAAPLAGKTAATENRPRKLRFRQAVLAKRAARQRKPARRGRA